MSEPWTPSTQTVRQAYEHAVGEGPEQFDRWLDQVKAAARREGQAEAWDECATESGARGWMHDYAVTEMQERNPYREEGSHVQ